MSSETQKLKIQADESQGIEQVETLSQSGEESAKLDGKVAKDQPSQEGEPKATEPEKQAEPEEKAESQTESSQPLPLTPSPMHPLRKAAPWVVIGCLAMVGLYQCGYSSGQSEERTRNALRVPEKEVVLQTNLKAIEEAVRNERAKQRVRTEAQFQVFVNGLEKNLGQLKSELEYQQLWARFTSGKDAGRCTKGVHSGYVSCTSGVMADLNEYLARLESRNICATGGWTAVSSDATTESTASEASAPQSAPPRVEYQDELVLKFCQRPEFESPDSAEQYLFGLLKKAVRENGLSIWKFFSRY